MNQVSFKVGDVVKVLTKDAQESKVHASHFTGTVIALRGENDSRTFTVRTQGTDRVFIEKIFPLNSPAIESITVIKENKVRRAKLYYLRKQQEK